MIRRSVEGALLAAVLLVAGLGAPPAAAACRVAIDIGHAREASNAGATSARGVLEWHFNAALAEHVDRAMAARDIPRLVLNRGGAPMALHERPRLAAEAGATLFVSLHHDSVQPHYLSSWEVDGQTLHYSDRFTGYSLFVSARNPALDESRRVAERAADGLLAGGLTPTLHHAEPIAGENRPLLDARRGVYQFDGLAVLRLATMPAVLVEAGIIVNRDEELRLATDTHRALVADALAAAAADHCARLR
jgi:N-acetylmuramoyl-L-alanine amidase